MSEVTRLSRVQRGLLALGGALVVVAILLPVVLRSTVFTYPGPAGDTTVDATGTATLLADPVTLEAPQATPAPLPLDVARRVHTVDTTGGTVVVEAEDAHSIDRLPPLRFTQRYTVDDRTLRNVAGQAAAYAYTPGNAVDRAPAYSVAFPFDAGPGPYTVWNDEIGQVVTFTQTGTATVDGRTLLRYRGTVEHADLEPALAAQLTAVGLPSSTTYELLKPRLRAAGIDVDLLDRVRAELEDADQQAVLKFESAIPLTYELTSEVQLLVEPRTGTIVSRDRVDETIAARPDAAGVGRLYAILVKPGDPNTQDDRAAAAAALAKLLAAPPTIPMISESYAQTPSSVAAMTATAGRWADEIVTWTTVVPIVVGVLGLVLVLVTAWLGRRRRPVAPADPEEPEVSGEESPRPPVPNA